MRSAQHVVAVGGHQRHQLDRTEGLRFAEMPRFVEQVDPEAGQVVVGEDGEPVMVPNQARDSWNLATTRVADPRPFAGPVGYSGPVTSP